MEKSKVDLFIAVNAENFNPSDLIVIKNQLEQMDDNQFLMIQSISYQKPAMILLIAILLGWDRFFLGEVGLGILKIITCYGCLIWWLIDIFNAKDRTKTYNMKKFLGATALV